MHSSVFQLSTLPIAKEDWLTEEQTFENIQNSLGTLAVDDVEMVSDKERADLITHLVTKWLPESMFETNADGSFTYKGGFLDWVATEYIPKIRKAALTLNSDCVFGIGIGSAYEVEKSINNPLEISSIFITSKRGYYSKAMKSGDLMGEFIKSLNPGAIIYIGAVFDYHF